MKKNALWLALSLLLMGGLSSCCLIGGCGVPPPKPPALLSKPGCETVVHRHCAPRSGDWLMQLHYGYDVEGRLVFVDSYLSTFHALDEDGQSKLTSINRLYRVSPQGKLVLLNQTIRDAQTRKDVQRSFYDPEIEHWMTLEEARREQAKEEQQEA